MKTYIHFKNGKSLEIPNHIFQLVVDAINNHSEFITLTDDNEKPIALIITGEISHIEVASDN